MSEEPRWLTWVREIQAVAQSGLTYAPDQYDRERYNRLRELAAEIMSEYTEADAQQIMMVFAEQTGYATPKVDVRGAVFQGDCIMLVREKADANRWTLPGGWADVNESPKEAIAKEVREEAGVAVRVTKLVAVWDRSRHPHRPLYPFHIWKLFFLCEIIGGKPRFGSETSEVAFFAENELPADLSIGRVLLPQLKRMFAHMRQPDLPTEFD
jgi:ADP-ribose pyrophosphatase YjhB (NUDIX family)